MKSFLIAILALLLLAPGAGAVNGYYPLDTIPSDINQWYADLFSLSGMTWVDPAVVWIDKDTTIDSGCGYMDDSSDILGYCWIDKTIYIDKQLMSDLTDKEDSMPFMILAHEYAHAMQDQAGVNLIVYKGQSGGGYDSIYQAEAESQADCMAGAYLRTMSTRKELSSSDLMDSIAVLEAHSDPTEAKPNSELFVHGNAHERAEATMTGFEQGIPGCMNIRVFN